MTPASITTKYANRDSSFANRQGSSIDAMAVLLALPGSKPSGRGYKACCPAHDDTKQSLFFQCTRDGTLLVHCFVCPTEKVLLALGLQWRDLFKDGGGSRAVGAPKIKHEEFRTPEGLKAVKKRIDHQNGGKSFVWYTPEGLANNMPGLGNLKESDLPLYGLLDLLDAPSNLPVIVCEGGKARDALKAKGFMAVSTPGGAGQTDFGDSLSVLKGRPVYLMPDNDQPGKELMQRIGDECRRKGISTCWLDWADSRMQPKDDAYDFLNLRGGTGDELRALMVKAKPYEPGRTAKGAIPSVGALCDTDSLEAGRIRLDTITPKRLRWLWKDRMALGKYGEIVGDGGKGKGLITADLVARITRGWCMPDGTPSCLGRPRGVVWIQVEDTVDDTIVPRLLAAGADLSRIILRTEVVTSSGTRPLDIRADLDVIRADVREVDAVVVIVDPVSYFMPDNANAHNDKSTRQALTPLVALAQELDIVVFGIRHINKMMTGNASDRGSGSKAYTNLARFSLCVGNDPQDDTGKRRILASTKHNTGAEAPSWAYVIEDASNEEYDADKICWLEKVDISADALLGTAPEHLSGHELSKIDEACDFLREALKNGKCAATALDADAKQLGISERTLDRAKTKMKVASKAEGFGSDRKWYWVLPAMGIDEVPDNGA